MGTANAGAGNDCGNRQIIVTTCTADPFTRTGCATADDISTYRTNYCTVGANIFNSSCGDANLYGDTNGARDTACLGTATNTLVNNDCMTRQTVINICRGDPFDATKPGCEALTTIDGIKTTYCTVGANIFDSECGLLTDTNDIIIGTNTARFNACVDVTTISGRPSQCGSEKSSGDSYIKAYCAVGGHADAVNNHRDCPTTAYLRKNTAATDATLASLTSTASAGKDRALNSTGTGLLSGSDLFVAGGAVASDKASSSDQAANFITDTVTGSPNTDLELSTDEDSTTNGASATFNSLDTAHNDEANGFAVLQGVYNGGVNKLYVGLLTGTDLGAPERSRTGTATWGAQLRAIVFNSTTFVNSSVGFNLSVNFTDKTLTATDVAAPSLSPLNINGRFTNNGVIYGTVDINRGPVNKGSLTGLIGEKGAVAIFKSDNNVNGSNPNAYVGGFVAAPELVDVTAAGFRGKARTGNAGTDVLTVLEATAPSTVIGSVNFIEGNAAILSAGANIALAREVALDADADTGVAFSFGNASPAGVANYHVGLLSGANVGPVLNSDVDGTWVGKIAAIVGANPVAEQRITFSINFNASSFAIVDTVNLGDLGGMTMDGNFRDNGVVYGTVNFGGATSNPGVLTGLIGQKALIGAFTGDGTGDSGNDTPYVGGFVAAPNTEPPVEIELNCTDDLGATPFDDTCEDNDDLQVQLCVDKDPLASAGNGFTANCEENTTVTGKVCVSSGDDANPFDTLCKDATIDTLTQKKNPLFKTAATLTL